MKFDLLIHQILDIFRSGIQGAFFWKAYQNAAKNLSVKQMNVTLEIDSVNQEKSPDSLSLSANIFLPQSMGIFSAEEVFVAMCRLLEENNLSIKAIKKGTVLQDNDLGLMMVPCTITLSLPEEKKEDKVMLKIGGVQTSAKSIRISVMRSQEELVSFGEDTPFGAYRAKTLYRITLTGFDGQDFEELNHFSFVPLDKSEFEFLNCTWSQYSLTDKEFTLISTERRKIV